MSLSPASEVLSGEPGVVLGVLLPHLAGVVVERVVVDAGVVQVRVRGRAEGVACPRCGVWCTRVHDRYWRRLADAPAGGRRVVIWLRVRVLWCENAGCAVRGFAEQPAGLASRYARRTPLLAAQLAAVAAEAGGRPAARLAGAVLAVQVSCRTLIRVLMALPAPSAGLVRVLGVDDFALRRRERYATILADMETGRPVEVLEGRDAGPLKAWLRRHPGVEVICRDRASAYAEAARAAAPHAVQVADRWHLWHNLCQYARKTVRRHHPRRAGPGGEGEPAGAAPQPAGPGAAGPQAVITSRYQQVCQLRAAGASLGQAAAELSVSRQLAGRYWRAASLSQLLTARPAPSLDPYKAYLGERWQQGTTSIAALHREITARGYTGSYTTVHGWLSLLKLAAPAKLPAPPGPGQVARWLLTDPATLDPAAAAALASIRARSPELDALAGHITAFATMLAGRHGDQLDTWLATVEADPTQPDLHSFTTGIRQDYQAVRNGLTLPWNSGRVEGLNTRTKLLHRQAYGRSSFPLLRQRILLTSPAASP